MSKKYKVSHMLLTLAACLQIGYAYAAPLPPSNVNVLITNDSSFPAKALITWNDNSNNEEGFSLSLYFGTTSELGYSYVFASTPANATSTYTDIYSTSSMPMYVAVSANSAGISSQKAFSNPFVGGIAPTSPSDILVTKQSQSTGSTVPVTISWKDNSTNELYFIVKAYYAGSMKPVLSTITNYPVQGTVDSGLTSYTFTGSDLINQIPATTTPLYFTVTAVNYYGESAEIKSADITLVSAPAAPSNVSASAPTGQSTGRSIPVTVKWTDNSINEDAFLVTAFNGVTKMPLLNGVITPITATVPNAATTATGTRSYTFSQANPMEEIPATTTPIYFTVTAINPYGRSDMASSTAKAFIQATTTPVIVQTPSYLFAFPYTYSVYVSATSTKRVSLAYAYWAPVPKVTGYILDRRIMLSATTTSTVGFKSFSLPSTSTTYIDMDVVAGKTYTYTIRALIGSQYSSPRISTPITIMN